jgi:hypothetical protein
VISLLSSFPAVHAAGVFVFASAFFRAVPTFCTVRADFVIDAAVFCYMSVALAFVATAYGDKVADLARIPRYVYFPPE